MNIKEVQSRLWEESKVHKANRESSCPLFPVNPHEKRIRKLMDLMHNPTWLREAAERTLTRSRGKKPGRGTSFSLHCIETECFDNANGDPSLTRKGTLMTIFTNSISTAPVSFDVLLPQTVNTISVVSPIVPCFFS